MFDSDLTSLDWLTSMSAQCPSVEVDPSSSAARVATGTSRRLLQRSSRDRSSSGASADALHDQAASAAAPGSISADSAVPTIGADLLSWLKHCEASNQEGGRSPSTPPEGVAPKHWRQQMAQAATNVANLIAHVLAEAQETKPTGLTSLQIVKAIVAANPCLSKRQQTALKTSVRQELLNNARFRRARKGKSDKPSCNACWILAPTSTEASKRRSSKQSTHRGSGKGESLVRRRKRAAKRRHAASVADTIITGARSDEGGCSSDSGAEEAARDHPPLKRATMARRAQEVPLHPETSTPPPPLDLFRHDWDTLLELAGEEHDAYGTFNRAVSRSSSTTVHSEQHANGGRPHPHRQDVSSRAGHCTPLQGGLVTAECPDSSRRRRHHPKRGKCQRGRSSEHQGSTSGSAMSDCDSEGVSPMLSAGAPGAFGTLDDVLAFGDPLFDTDLQMELPPTPTFGLPGAHGANLAAPAKAFSSPTFPGSLGLGAHHLLLPTSNASALSSTSTSSPRSVKGEEATQAARASKGANHSSGNSEKSGRFVSSFALALSDEEGASADDSSYSQDHSCHGRSRDGHTGGSKGQGAFPNSRLSADTTGEGSYTAFPFGDLGSSFTTAQFRQMTPAM